MRALRTTRDRKVGIEHIQQIVPFTRAEMYVGVMFLRSTTTVIHAILLHGMIIVHNVSK